MREIVTSIILFLISAGAFTMSVLSFMERGFLFNNAYIYATKAERDNMDKTPHYRQSAVVFLLMGIIFLLNGLSVLLRLKWMFYIVTALCIAAIVFAIVSSVIIEKRTRK